MSSSFFVSFQFFGYRKSLLPCIQYSNTLEIKTIAFINLFSIHINVHQTFMKQEKHKLGRLPLHNIN